MWGTGVRRRAVIWSAVWHSYDALTWRNKAAESVMAQATRMATRRFKKALTHSLRYRRTGVRAAA